MQFDTRSFRDALGCFATGVTVITARGVAGEDIGITVNSFSSVSLDPPLVLWSLGRGAQHFSGFLAAEHFAIHILAAGQEELSNQFATQGYDKFAGIEIIRAEDGVPQLKNCAARFHCTTAFRYEGGDHVIVVGRVTDFEHGDQRPLVFHRGRYGRLSED